MKVNDLIHEDPRNKEWLNKEITAWFNETWAIKWDMEDW